MESMPERGTGPEGAAFFPGGHRPCSAAEAHEGIDTLIRHESAMGLGTRGFL
jgi:hypothetical protein